MGADDPAATGRIGDEARARLLAGAPSRDGTVVDGRFRILSPLGAGGGGEVYVAYDLDAGGRVALKLLAPGTTPGGDEAFEREPRLALRLDHPGLARTLALGEWDGRAWVASELVDGETLAKRLRRGPLPAEEAARCILALLEALAYLHASGVAHRDVKPGNLVLSPRGPRLLDYGLARRLGIRPLSSGELWGTAEYLSPEQVGGGPGDHRTDLYAASVVLWEVLAGAPPFRGGTPLETARARGLGSPRPPGSPAPGSAGLLAVAVRGMAVDPEARFPSARAMADAIRRAPTGRAGARALTRALRADAERLLGREPRAERIRRLALPIAVAATIAIAGFATWWVRNGAIP